MDFSRNMQRTCFYGVLGAVASRWFVGPPRAFCLSYFSRNFNIFSQSLPGDFSVLMCK